jgi:hypothetical protein
VLLFGGLVAGLGAAPAAGGEGNVKRFCKANLAVDNADAPSDRLLERLRDAAPPEIAETVDAAVTAFQEQGEDAFEDETFLTALGEIDEFVLDNCGYEQIEVSMQDYAFDGVPDEVNKGVVAFNLTNDGAELHEFTIGRLKGDATLEDILDLPEDAPEEDYEEFIREVPGGGFAFPEESDLALVNLKKTGNYVALCFIPVGSTPDAAEEGGSGPPHLHEGMAAEFEVTK